MSKKSDSLFTQPLLLKPRGSRRLKYWLGSSHLLAFVGLIYSDLVWWLVLLLGLTLYLSYKRAINQATDISALTWLRDNDWHIQFRNGYVADANLSPMSFALNFLVILVFKQADGRRASLVILPDSLDGNSFRRLKKQLTILTTGFFKQTDDKAF